MTLVFISYSSKDRDFVLRLSEDLREAGFEIWLDQWMITGRKPYWSEIQEGVESCTHFLFVISPDSIADDSGAMTELYHAEKLRPRKVIVPVVARETSYDDLPMLITPGKYQIHDFSKLSYQVALAKVSRALQSNGPTLTADVPRPQVVEQAPSSPLPQQAPLLQAVPAAQQHSGRVANIPGGWATIAAVIIAGALGLGAVFFSTINSNQQAQQTQTAMALNKMAEPSATTSDTSASTSTKAVTLISNTAIAAQTSNAVNTQNARTAIMKQTADALAAANNYTATAKAIAAFTKTPLPTIRPTAAPTSTTVILTIIAAIANVRSGPGISYDVFGHVSKGEQWQAYGRNNVGSYVMIKFNGRDGWVNTLPTSAQISGEVNGLPVIADPPTPTPLATATSPLATFPDLRLVNYEIEPSPIIGSQPFTLTISVRNDGNKATGLFTMTANFWPGEAPHGVDVSNLDPGEQITMPIEYSGVSLAPGNYTITVLLDSNSEVDEGASGETNNRVNISYTVH